MTVRTTPQLRGYEADRRVGEAPHAEFWLGRRSGDGLLVGLTVIDPGLARLTGFGPRLAAVALQVKALRHPRIVGTMETAAGERSLALVTEPVDGIPLSALLTRGESLPAATAMQVVDDVLRAIGAAHAASIVHCGIDPTRVLVTAQGEVRLDGFALARVLALTGGEAGAPSVGFASPERLGGSLPDGLGDLWAAAALAHLLLAGSTPVPGTAAAIPALPGLREVLVKALAADPARRYANAAAMRGALTATAAETLGQDWRSGSDLGGRAAEAIEARDGRDRPATPLALVPEEPAPPPAISSPPVVGGASVNGGAPGGGVADRVLPTAAAAASPRPVAVATSTLPPRERAVPTMAATPRRRRRRWPLVLLLVVVLSAGAAAAAWLATGRPNPFSTRSAAPVKTGPLQIGSDIVVTVRRDVADAAACDVTYTFSATGSLSGQGDLTYHFEQSNTQRTADQTIPITNQSSFQLPHKWRFMGHRTGSQTVTFVITAPAGPSGPTRVAKDFDTTC